MSIVKNITTYPATTKDFSPQGNFIQKIAGMFLVKTDVTFTESELETSDKFFELLEDNDIFPLHLIQSVSTSNEDTIKQASLQDYDYKLRSGKYKHTMRFDWSRELHEIVETYSGSDLYAIYYDDNFNLILSKDGSTYRGIKTDSLILQKQLLFSNGSEPVYSDFDIELKSGEDIQVINIDWSPELIDKLFISINILLAQPTFINFTIKYNSNNIETITASDVDIVDDNVGDITGLVVNYTDGIYQASNFSSNVTSGCLTVNSSIYLGAIKYRVTVTVGIATTFDLLDGDGFDLLDGDGFDLLETS